MDLQFHHLSPRRYYFHLYVLFITERKAFCGMISRIFECLIFHHVIHLIIFLCSSCIRTACHPFSFQSTGAFPPAGGRSASVSRDLLLEIPNLFLSAKILAFVSLLLVIQPSGAVQGL